jgi:hypothetical protein
MPESLHFPPPVTFGEEMVASEADIYVPYPIDLPNYERGALGLFFAQWIKRGLLAINPIDFTSRFEARFDARVFGFALAATPLSVLVFGLVPALQGSRSDMRSVHQSGTRVPGSRGQLRVKNALVAGQVAVAIVLLVAPALTIRSERRLERSGVPGGTRLRCLDVPPPPW